MKLSANQLRDATLTVSQIIRESRSMPQIGKFRLARLHAKLIPEFTVIEIQRDNLIKEHGALVEGETDKWQVPDANMADFNAAWKVIADHEIEVDVIPIPIGDLDSIEAGELVMLGELVSE